MRELRKPIVGFTDGCKFTSSAQRNVSMDAQIGANSPGFTSLSINTDFSILEETGSESKYANLIASPKQDLHTASTPEIPGDV